MAEARRISPAAARRAMDENDALLICGYEDPEKYRAYHLEGSISFSGSGAGWTASPRTGS